MADMNLTTIIIAILGIGLVVIAANNTAHVMATSQINKSDSFVGTMKIIIQDENNETLLDLEEPIVLCPDPQDTSIWCSGIDGTGPDQN